jgi:hypothetical protein
MDAMPIDHIDNTMNQPIELAKKWPDKLAESYSNKGHPNIRDPISDIHI